MINLNHYVLGAQFSRHTYKQGGVSIFVSRGVQYQPIELNNFNKEKDLEVCALKVDLQQTNLIIICIYRSPNGDYKYFLKQLEAILVKLCKGSTKLILCGDFNINHFELNSRRNLLQSLLASFNLFSTITFPTRVTNNSSTLIDNIYMDITNYKFSVYPLINGISDHDAQVIELANMYNEKPKNHYSFTRKIDCDTSRSFTEDLSYENWEEIFLDDDVNKIFNKFLDTYIKIFNANFPMVIKKKSTKPNSWITSGIKISCKNKRNLYVKYRNSRDPTHKAQYKDYCKILSSVIRAAKKMYFDALIQKSNNKIKTTWNLVKSLLNNKTNTNMNNTNDNINNQNTANAFNSYFASVADNIINNSRKTNSVYSDCPLEYLRLNCNQPNFSFTLKNTTAHEINKIIQSMKPKDSHGYDEISIRILKMSAPFILSPLTYIFNKILDKGIFPERLKFSEIKPLYKKGNAADFSNYRPISLLPSFSKIIEKLIYNRLYNYFDQQKLFAKDQHGFRLNTSTETATFSLLNTILSSLEHKDIVGSLFLDLQKAFDCVNHDILLAKLNFYGVSGKANKLLESYIRNRYQRVKLRDKFFNHLTSEWEPVRHGVPQGSVLGPLLFLIYINDLPHTINDLADTVLFADDTSIIISNPDLQEFKYNTSRALQELNKWFCSNLLSLSFDKSHFLQFFVKKQNKINVQITSSNSILTNLNSIKFLGLTLDSMLTWKDHIANLTIKLNKACFAIRAIKPYMSLSVLRTVYFSYFHSIMSYGIIFWGSSNLSNNIFKIQKRVIRIIANKFNQDSCRQLFNQYQILTLPAQYIFSLVMFVVKFKDFFQSNSEIHDLNTRFRSDLHFPTTNLSLVQRGVVYSGTKIFNHLPSHIKSFSKDIKQFKYKLKRLLLEQSLYTLEEFYQTTFK
jgi:hypothetical protein